MAELNSVLIVLNPAGQDTGLQVEIIIIMMIQKLMGLFFSEYLPISTPSCLVEFALRTGNLNVCIELV